MTTHRSGETEFQEDLISWAREVHGAPPDLAPCHRLDRGTSGLVICASDPGVRADLGRAFAAGEIVKTYLALVHGRAPRGGTITRPLHDRRRGRRLPAETAFRRIQCWGGLTYLNCVPGTGRKHQIRRHLRGLGLPIWGDTRYGRRESPLEGPQRLWLHAHSLVLPDGRKFEAPLPPELEAHLVALHGQE